MSDENNYVLNFDQKAKVEKAIQSISEQADHFLADGKNTEGAEGYGDATKLQEWLDAGMQSGVLPISLKKYGIIIPGLIDPADELPPEPPKPPVLEGKETFEEKALKAFDEGNYTEAELFTQKWLETEPGNPEASKLLQDIRKTRKNYELKGLKDQLRSCEDPKELERYIKRGRSSPSTERSFRQGIGRFN